MRHGKKFNHLGRKSAHRKAMLANMANSLIEHKRIRTTVAKAKALRVYIEPLITKAKNAAKDGNPETNMHTHRVVFSYLKNKHAVKELFTVVAEKVANRPGGYTRILKIGNRLGDNAEMAIIELVDFNELAPGKASDGGSGKSSRRRRRRGGAKKAAAPVAEAVEDVVEEVEDAVEEVTDEVEEVVEDVAEDNDDASDSDDDDNDDDDNDDDDDKD
jgi:large subunit ribosomal protein L17